MDFPGVSAPYLLRDHNSIANYLVDLHRWNECIEQQESANKSNHDRLPSLKLT